MHFFTKEWLKATAGVLATLAIILLPIVSAAATSQFQTGDSNTTHFETGGQSNTLQNPLAVSSFCQLINLLLKAALVIGIPIAVLFIVYAGFKFILARGSPGALTEARANFVATLIGVAIFIGASVIASVILNTLVQLGASNVASC